MSEDEAYVARSRSLSSSTSSTSIEETKKRKKELTLERDQVCLFVWFWKAPNVPLTFFLLQLALEKEELSNQIEASREQKNKYLDGKVWVGGWLAWLDLIAF